MAKIRTAHHAARGTVNENGRTVKSIINAFTAQYGGEDSVALSALSAGTVLESGMVMNSAAFEELAVTWLAWRFCVSESDLREVTKKFDALKRYEIGFDHLFTSFEDVPGYMGDAAYGDQLMLVLSATRALAQWRDIDFPEFYEQLGIEVYDEDEDGDDD